MFRFKRKKFLIMQASFNRSGFLEIQTLLACSATIARENPEVQVTLDKWLQPIKKPSVQQFQKELKAQSNPWTMEDWNDTITCIELTMKRDKRGCLVDWMKGEPYGDSWDGSVDNQEETLEKHVSKYGWQF